jgi:hypothetical protein
MRVQPTKFGSSGAGLESLACLYRPKVLACQIVSLVARTGSPRRFKTRPVISMISPCAWPVPPRTIRPHRAKSKLINCANCSGESTAGATASLSAPLVKRSPVPFGAGDGQRADISGLHVRQRGPDGIDRCRDPAAYEILYAARPTIRHMSKLKSDRLGQDYACEMQHRSRGGCAVSHLLWIGGAQLTPVIPGLRPWSGRAASAGVLICAICTF